MADEEKTKKSFIDSFIKSFKTKFSGQLNNKEIKTLADKIIPNDADLDKLSITQILASPVVQNLVMRKKSDRLKEFKDGGMVSKKKPKVAGRLALRGYGRAMKGRK
jgi:hypothetical protein